MKGIVFNFRNNKRALRLPGIRRPALGLSGLLSRYGIQALLFVLFFMGLCVGAAGSRGFDKELWLKLDFLFVTNIKARLTMSPFEVFVSCFVSYFLFVFTLFLFALSYWGFAASPLLCVFKGFSVGLSSAFLFSEYSAAGIGFYIVVVLPGTVGFLFTLIRYSKESMLLSLSCMRCAASDNAGVHIRSRLKSFLKNSLLALLYSCACAVADMLLWVLLADKFHLI